tara:strand:- start:246 stop:497 length:252 start_codon:yes stop_codon:yes gene_type:complete
MLDNLLYNIGLYKCFFDEDYNLMNIKNNLKHTVTLKKKFYVPTKKEIVNKYQMWRNRIKPKIDINELLEIKKNLSKLSKKNIK